MNISKIAIIASLVFAVNHSFAQDDETVETRTTTTTTETPEGVTTTKTTEDYDKEDEGAGAGGFFFEPGIRYDNIQGDLDFPAPFGESDIEADGVGLNARVGFHVFDIMFLAAEGNYSQLHVDEDTTNYSSDGSAWSYGPTLGFQTPWAGVRLWGTYIADGEFDPSSSNNVDLKFEDLNGYKVGVGFRFAKFGASLEYVDATYEDVDVENLSGLTGETDLELDHTAWVAQISFPISL